ncbi:N-acetylmuramoyl-L-alanine amidase [Yoonia maricola]|uniref:N-acetylmuramoyl-L-alanine amidase n=1 Tax=Yoonia maricola TaxID=420999 RepID=UPI00145557AA|nr:N-acetylmuramoyl-L-alanine amidase [Yoonia maricola]
MVVIHYTAMQSANAACDVLCDPKGEVSAHYLIDETGHVISLVPEAMRAWHAGAGAWGATQDVNSRSIGIELANTGFTPFAAAQMDALSDVLHAIKQRWDIRPERIIGHSDMAPGRKIDPGARFDWRRLALEGLSVWPSSSACAHSSEVALQGADEARFAAAMKTFGYTAVEDADLLLKTFRLRFRPHANGPLDMIDLAMIADLAQRFPVDVNASNA